jgi:hypothetical protein
MRRGVAIFSFHHWNFPKPSADHLTHGVLMASMYPAGDSYNRRPSDLQKLQATMVVAPCRAVVQSRLSVKKLADNLKGAIITKRMTVMTWH